MISFALLAPLSNSGYSEATCVCFYTMNDFTQSEHSLVRGADVRTRVNAFDLWNSIAIGLSFRFSKYRAASPALFIIENNFV